MTVELQKAVSDALDEIENHGYFIVEAEVSPFESESLDFLMLKIKVDRRDHSVDEMVNINSYLINKYEFLSKFGLLFLMEVA
jgi:hypothetical protein